jgi:plastocyanin
VTARVAAIAGGLALSLLAGAPGVSLASGHARRPAVTIRFGEFFYKPADATVHVGQPVRFVNVGKIAHTVADTDAHWRIRSRLIHPRPLAHGQSQTVVFTKPGLVRYLCTFHPTLMRGEIRVVP